ncbi:putative E3 ubiquitin-protein ligase LUL4 [Vanrija pseudolonga]|uniref:E3 ubiquitin-protein ligase LUL4 n=1 Tax=Vanrija pseudolonga TaxID=143232 RepID=A0AAF0YLD3_9TREE|nr:putative E3 ubiquitin-protein ligase LUL4 [Vanrija pseudolonga]
MAAPGVPPTPTGGGLFSSLRSKRSPSVAEEPPIPVFITPFPNGHVDTLSPPIKPVRTNSSMTSDAPTLYRQTPLERLVAMGFVKADAAFNLRAANGNFQEAYDLLYHDSHQPKMFRKDKTGTKAWFKEDCAICIRNKVGGQKLERTDSRRTDDRSSIRSGHRDSFSGQHQQRHAPLPSPTSEVRPATAQPSHPASHLQDLPLPDVFSARQQVADNLSFRQPSFDLSSIRQAAPEVPPSVRVGSTGTASPAPTSNPALSTWSGEHPAHPPQTSGYSKASAYVEERAASPPPQYQMSPTMTSSTNNSREAEFTFPLPPTQAPSSSKPSSPTDNHQPPAPIASRQSSHPTPAVTPYSKPPPPVPPGAEAAQPSSSARQSSHPSPRPDPRIAELSEKLRGKERELDVTTGQRDALHSLLSAQMKGDDLPDIVTAIAQMRAAQRSTDTLRSELQNAIRDLETAQTRHTDMERSLAEARDANNVDRESRQSLTKERQDLMEQRDKAVTDCRKWQGKLKTERQRASDLEGQLSRVRGELDSRHSQTSELTNRLMANAETVTRVLGELDNAIARETRYKQELATEKEARTRVESERDGMVQQYVTTEEQLTRESGLRREAEISRGIWGQEVDTLRKRIGELEAAARRGGTSVIGPECVVCNEETAALAPVKCGHLCLCSGCSKKVLAQGQRCPMCRETVTKDADLIRIYVT